MVVIKGDGIQTCIICGYNPCKPCKTKRVLSSTSYSQHRGYLIQSRKDNTTCPRKCFREDLIKQMKTWHSRGNRLIVCMDANDHIYKEAIGTELTDNNGLAIKEVVLN